MCLKYFNTFFNLSTIEYISEYTYIDHIPIKQIGIWIYAHMPMYE